MSSRAFQISLRVVSAALILGGGCKTHASDAAPSMSAAPPPSASVAVAAPPAKPWFSGDFQGNYEAKLAPVEVKTGAVREWAADDGKASSGPGKLDLKIDDEGVVVGTGDGSLGASQASGKVEDDTLRVVLSPNDGTGLRGVLVATRDGEGFRGSIEASTGDSLRVRQAPIELKKQAN
ncbi:MAG TPA: hypothetical protein VNW92_30885 [Polyangiaceae bacterium]|jgi:hypothetical protein|nr:hypothetical protein [Polyangiaceae bacterium]